MPFIFAGINGLLINNGSVRSVGSACQDPWFANHYSTDMAHAIPTRLGAGADSTHAILRNRRR